MARYRPRYATPVPAGTLGRTDQGVDVSAPAGSPVYAVTNERLVGIIRNWYQNQPFYWFKMQGGGYDYVAEQFRSKLRIGQSVRKGQQIGTVAPSGTGLELGYATRSGQTLARATTGYTEGEATPAGQAYRRNVLGNSGNITRVPGTPTPQTPITRPGGTPVGQSNSPEAVKQFFQSYTSLRDTPRTAPPGTKNPFKWFWASFSGNWAGMAGNADSGGSDNTSESSGSPSVPQVVGSVTSSLLARVGGGHGWQGQQIDDWMEIIKEESGGDPNAVNPDSGAYGIGQMLANGGSPSNLGPNIQKYRQYGGNPNTVLGQLIGDANYIASRYGNPSAALAHEKKYGWY